MLSTCVALAGAAMEAAPTSEPVTSNAPTPNEAAIFLKRFIFDPNGLVERYN